MPKQLSNNRGANKTDWRQQLERDRLLNLMHQQSVGSPINSPTPPEWAMHEATENSPRDWAQQLEQTRLKSNLHLPGPGAAAGGTSFPMQKNKLEGLQKTVAPADKGQYGAAKSGLIGYIFMLMAAASEEATKPVLKQLLVWHWGLTATIKGALISMLITGPALNFWLIHVHIMRRKGLSKFDPFDLLSLLLFDFLVLLFVGVILVAISLAGVTVLCLYSPSDCPAFIVDIGITTLF